MECCGSVLEAEVRGIIAGTELASKMGLQEVDFVSDSINAVLGIWEEDMDARQIRKALDAF